MIISLKRLTAVFATFLTFIVLFLAMFIWVDRLMNTIHPAWATRGSAYTVEVDGPATELYKPVHSADGADESAPVNRLFYFWYHGE
ncbi:MAG: hypothetical protein IMX04_06425 [Candidatus Carbobacillus altaicus]|uniref:DUF4227 family protein n=1 Tax=Candidatus Carbonibacillus altaicus TaxID=2163959 RepID=A0A2R6Y377_9BACL|nr:hypothetical protein [Candidatus Carbobacillus altaicus]PTQ57121.1 MAG: hypothetical protein BSOLF_2153 [Candidatus Carbobacillus altaicus]